MLLQSKSSGGSVQRRAEIKAPQVFLFPASGEGEAAVPSYNSIQLLHIKAV
jgi:hypothetical protein